MGDRGKLSQWHIAYFVKTQFYRIVLLFSKCNGGKCNFHRIYGIYAILLEKKLFYRLFLTEFFYSVHAHIFLLSVNVIVQDFFL